MPEKKELEPMMIPYGYVPCVPGQDDTIDVMEIFRTLKRRYKTIVAVTALLVAGAGGYIVLSKPVYEADTMLRIGKIGGDVLIDANDLKNQLVNAYHVNDRRMRRQFPFVSSVSVPKGSKILVTLKAQAHDTKAALTLLKRIADQVIQNQKGTVDRYLNIQLNDIKHKQEQIATIRKTLNESEQSIGILAQKMQQADQDSFPFLSAQYSKALGIIQNLHQKIDALNEKITTLRLNTVAPYIQQPSIVESTAYEQPVKPKKALLLIVAMITGVILGVFMALFQEWLANAKREEKESDAGQ